MRGEGEGGGWWWWWGRLASASSPKSGKRFAVSGAEVKRRTEQGKEGEDGLRAGESKGREKLYLITKDTVLPLDALEAFVSLRPSVATPSIVPDRASEPFDPLVALLTERAFGTNLRAKIF